MHKYINVVLYKIIFYLKLYVYHLSSDKIWCSDLVLVIIQM